MTDSVVHYLVGQQKSARLSVYTDNCNANYRCIKVRDSATGVTLELSTAMARALRKQLKLVRRGDEMTRPHEPKAQYTEYPGFVLELEEQS